MKLLIFLRSLLGVLVFFPVVTFVLCVVVLVNVFTVNSQRFSNALIDLWARAACAIFGVELEINGRENLRGAGQGGLYLFNHSSFFDIFALYVMDPSLRYGSKIEIFKIPLFGFTMRKLGTLPIPRENRQEAIRVYEEAGARAKAGQRFALSPEGGRGGGSGDELRPFKAGPFIFAINSQMDILPVIIKNADLAWPKGALVPALNKWTNTITIEVLPAIPIEPYGLNKRVELRDRTFAEMSMSFGR